MTPASTQPFWKQPGAAGNSRLRANSRLTVQLTLAAALSAVGHVLLAPLVQELFAPQVQRAARVLPLQIQVRQQPLAAEPEVESTVPQPTPAEPAVPEPAATAAAPSPPDTRPPTGAASSRFLPTDDVDQPAAPQGEWSIDTTRLPLGVIYRAQLGIWIDAAGQIQRVEIDELRPDDDLARKALQNLVSTQMLPALLSGLPVGNVRHIELSFGQE